MVESSWDYKIIYWFQCSRMTGRLRSHDSPSSLHSSILLLPFVCIPARPRRSLIHSSWWNHLGTARYFDFNVSEWQVVRKQDRTSRRYHRCDFRTWSSSTRNMAKSLKWSIERWWWMNEYEECAGGRLHYAGENLFSVSTFAFPWPGFFTPTGACS